MRLVDFAQFLMEKSSYLFEHPYYKRVDLILRDIIKEFLKCLTKKEMYTIKSNIDLKLALKDIKVISNKIRERKVRNKKRKGKINELADMYDAVITNIQNQVDQKDFDKNKELVDKIKQIEQEIENE